MFANSSPRLCDEMATLRPLIVAKSPEANQARYPILLEFSLAPALLVQQNARDLHAVMKEPLMAQHHPASTRRVPSRLALQALGFLDGVCQRCLNPEDRRPMILIVVGVPGAGKSVMTRTILSQAGIEVHSLPASAFAGPHEGMSVRPFRNKILDLGAGKHNEHLPPKVLMIEDFDRGLGGRDAENREGHTVNSDLLVTETMAYADDPFKITVPEDLDKGTPEQTFKVRPTAIVMTANDTTRIHAALRRFGRARIIKWEPTASEMLEMVAGLFPNFEEPEIRALVDSFPHHQIGFFEALLSELGEAFAQDQLAAHQGDYRGAFTEDAVRKRARPPADLARQIGIDRIIEFGAALSERQAAVNLLTDRRIKNVRHSNRARRAQAESPADQRPARRHIRGLLDGVDAHD
jgi:hypothetical protein